MDEITKKKHSYKNEDSFLIDINIIREKYGLKNNEVFSDLGFHWNFYSSCLFTNEFLFKANLNSIDCEDYEYKNAQMTDIDIFMIHPFFDRTNFSKKLKYPKLSKDKIQHLPRIAIIGDSFVDQIIYNILHSTSIENLKKITFFDYFDVQKKINPDGTYDVSDLVLNEKFISEFEKNEFVVMVLSDSNYPRNINSESFYGFHTFLKEHYAF